jgi:hypothetical protein
MFWMLELPTIEAAMRHDELASGQAATIEATHAGRSPQLTVPIAPPAGLAPPPPAVPPVPGVPPVAPDVPPVTLPPVPPVLLGELLPHAAAPIVRAQAIHAIKTSERSDIPGM